jgi:hypothetical protein
MRQPEHTPGPWALGHSTLHGSNGEPIMIARTFLMLTPADRSLIIAAPDLLAACQQGGPTLLTQAADLLQAHAPTVAAELRLKAEAERVAIALVKDGYCV